MNLSFRRCPSLVPWFILAAFIVAVDQVTKIIAAKKLVGGYVQVTSFFNLILAHNHGAAFSFLAGEGGWQKFLFIGISVAAIIFFIYLLFRFAQRKLFVFGVTLLLGGAVGNLIDRAFYGYVIDFLDFHIGSWHWPAFNVADMAVCCGAFFFLLDEFRHNKKSKKY